jgi:hypothetical protein
MDKKLYCSILKVHLAVRSLVFPLGNMRNDHGDDHILPAGIVQQPVVVFAPEILKDDFNGADEARVVVFTAKCKWTSHDVYTGSIFRVGGNAQKYLGVKSMYIAQFPTNSLGGEGANPPSSPHPGPPCEHV